MKTKLIYLACSVLAIVISGCSSIEVSENYDPSYDFSQAKTFDWYAENDYKHELILKQIRHELKAQLEAKGITQKEDNPDLVVAIYGGTKDKVSIRSTNIGYTYGGWYGGRGVDVYQYKEGTLVLDFIDRKTKQLVFRSKAIVEVSQNISMEKRQKRIQNVIREAIKSFPPAKK